MTLHTSGSDGAPAAERPGRADSTRGALDAGVVSATLALLVLVLALVDVWLAPDFPVGLLDGSSATAAGMLAAVVQAGLVLCSRTRPRLAFGLLSAFTPVQFALIMSAPGYAWGVLAYAAARSPGRALGWIAVATSVPLAATTAWVVADAPTPDAMIDALLILYSTAVGGALYVLIGVVAGRLARAAALRTEERRRAADRVRRSAALADERNRIAEEIGDGVLAALRRFVTRVEAFGGRAPGAVDREELRGIHEQARSVLASMRRVLQALRAPSPDTRSEPGLGAEARDGRTGDAPRCTAAWWPPPAPGRPGFVAVVVVAALVLAGGLVGAEPSGDAAFDRFTRLLVVPWQDATALIVLSLQIAAVGWWRAAPVPAVLTTAAGSATCALLGSGNLFADFAWLLPVWGVASRAAPGRSGPAVAASSLLVLAGSSVNGTLLGYVVDMPLDALVVYSPVPLLWLAGVFTYRHRSDLAGLRRQEILDGDRRLLADERMRVARDLHDVVAHHVSAVAVQAGAARVLPEEAVPEAVGHMVDAARRITAALPELAHLTPAAGDLVLDGAVVESLVEPARHVGLQVTVEVHGRPADPPGDADLFARSILLEALTNVVRHAGPTEVRVRIDHDPDAVVVTVEDSGPIAGHQPTTAGSGLGLVGMRERATLLDGLVQAGPYRSGWRVHAVLHRPSAARS